MSQKKKVLEAQLDYLCKELDKVEQTDNSYQQQLVIIEEIDYHKAELVKLYIREELSKIKAKCGN